MIHSIPYRIGVISDTHGIVNPKVFTIFDGVDLILHSGDIGNDDVLIELAAIAPVRAVSGNVDGIPVSAQRPLFQQLETPVGRIAMTHGHLARCPAGQPGLMVRHFQEFAPNIIIFGHTHIPTLTEIDGVTLFNPGAAGRIRVGGRHATVGLIEIEPGLPAPRLQHVPLI